MTTFLELLVFCLSVILFWGAIIVVTELGCQHYDNVITINGKPTIIVKTGYQIAGEFIKKTWKKVTTKIWYSIANLFAECECEKFPVYEWTEEERKMTYDEMTKTEMEFYEKCLREEDW